MLMQLRLYIPFPVVLARLPADTPLPLGETGLDHLSILNSFHRPILLNPLRLETEINKSSSRSPCFFPPILFSRREIYSLLNL